MFLGTVQTMAAQAGTDQIAVQRYLAVTNIRESQKVAAIGSLLNCLISFALPVLGISIFAYYESLGTNPVDAGVVTADQIFPYFFTTALPTGLAGVLMAALFATTMSVYSGGLNAATTCIFMDFIQISSCEMSTNDNGKTPQASGMKRQIDPEDADNMSDNSHDSMSVGLLDDDKIKQSNANYTIFFKHELAYS